MLLYLWNYRTNMIRFLLNKNRIWPFGQGGPGNVKREDAITGNAICKTDPICGCLATGGVNSCDLLNEV